MLFAVYVISIKKNNTGKHLYSCINLCSNCILSNSTHIRSIISISLIPWRSPWKLLSRCTPTWRLFSVFLRNLEGDGITWKRPIQAYVYTGMQTHESCMKYMVRLESIRSVTEQKCHHESYHQLTLTHTSCRSILGDVSMKLKDYCSPTLTCRLAVERKGVMVGRIFPKASCRLSWSASSSLPVTLTRTGSKACA